MPFKWKHYFRSSKYFFTIEINIIKCSFVFCCGSNYTGRDANQTLGERRGSATEPADLHTRTPTHKHTTDAHKHSHIHVLTDAHKNSHTHTPTHTHIYTHTQTHTQKSSFSHTHTNKETHPPTHTHTHTQHTTHKMASVRSLKLLCIDVC